MNITDILIIVFGTLGFILVLAITLYAKRVFRNRKKNGVKRTAFSLGGNFVEDLSVPISKKYDLTKQALGSGSSAQVIMGIDRSSKRKYAIKVIDLARKEVRWRYEREKNFLRDIDHTNVVRLYEVYSAKKALYFVMELCTGGHLGQVLRARTEGHLGEETACEYVLQLTRAIGHIHHHGICHRDIKLQNILLESSHEDAQIKLVDFGNGARFRNNLPLTKVVGTTYTAAPEVFKENYDERCDVWSLGVVTYILLSGKRPFEKMPNGVSPEPYLQQLQQQQQQQSQAGMSSSKKMGAVSSSKRDAATNSVVASILSGNYHFNDDCWGDISSEAVNFIKNCLVMDYTKRNSANSMLEHPWFQQEDEPSGILQTARLSQNSADSLRRTLKNELSSQFSGIRHISMLAVAFAMPTESTTLLRKLFQDIDTNGSGTIEREEFIMAMRHISPKSSREEVDALFERFDQDENRCLSFTEFLAAALDPKDVELDELRNAFRLIDRGNKGYIDRDDLARILCTTDVEHLEPIMGAVGAGFESSMPQQQQQQQQQQQAPPPPLGTSHQQSAASQQQQQRLAIDTESKAAIPSSAGGTGSGKAAGVPSILHPSSYSSYSSESQQQQKQQPQRNGGYDRRASPARLYSNSTTTTTGTAPAIHSGTTGTSTTLLHSSSRSSHSNHHQNHHQQTAAAASQRSRSNSAASIKSTNTEEAAELRARKLEQRIDEIMCQADLNGDGVVSYHEVMYAMAEGSERPWGERARKLAAMGGKTLKNGESAPLHYMTLQDLATAPKLAPHGSFNSPEQFFDSMKRRLRHKPEQNNNNRFPWNLSLWRPLRVLPVAVGLLNDDASSKEPKYREEEEEDQDQNSIIDAELGLGAEGASSGTGAGAEAAGSILGPARSGGSGGGGGGGGGGLSPVVSEGTSRRLNSAGTKANRNGNGNGNISAPAKAVGASDSSQSQRQQQQQQQQQLDPKRTARVGGINGGAAATLVQEFHSEYSVSVRSGGDDAAEEEEEEEEEEANGIQLLDGDIESGRGQRGGSPTPTPPNPTTSSSSSSMPRQSAGIGTGNTRKNARSSSNGSSAAATGRASIDAVVPLIELSREVSPSSAVDEEEEEEEEVGNAAVDKKSELFAYFTTNNNNAPSSSNDYSDMGTRRKNQIVQQNKVASHDRQDSYLAVASLEDNDSVCG